MSSDFVSNFLSRLCGGEDVKEYSIDNEQFLSRLCGGEDTKPVPVIDALVSKPPVWRGRGG